MTPAQYRELVLRLAVLADGYAPVLAGILEITPRAVLFRLQARSIRKCWREFVASRRARGRSACQRRRWWRWRLSAVGMTPALLDPSDPLWFACHRLPRGSLVAHVAATMRQEVPGISLARPDALAALVVRCEALATATTSPDLAVLEARAGIRAVPPAPDVIPLPHVARLPPIKRRRRAPSIPSDARSSD